MAASLGTLTADLQMNIARFEKGLERAERIAQKRSRSLQKIMRRAGSVAGAALGAALGGGLLVGAKEATKAFTEIANTADKLGVTTKSLQELRFAAAQAGVDVKAFEVGFQRFTRRAADAAAGNKGLAKTFDDLGVKLTSGGGLRPGIDVFLDFADAIKNTDDGGQQLLNTFKLFDTEGVALVNLLRQGSDEINKLRDNANRLGAVVEDSVIRKAERAGNELAAMAQVIDAQLNAALIDLAPLLVSTATNMAKAATAVGMFFDQFRDPANRTSIQGIEDDIFDLQDEIDGLVDKISNPSFFRSESGLQNILDGKIAEMQALNARLEFLTNVSTPSGIAAPTGGTPPPSDTGSEKTKVTFEEITKELQAQNDLIAMQHVLTNQQYEAAKQVLDAQKQLGRDLTKDEEARIASISAEAKELESLANALALTHDPATDLAKDMSDLQLALDKGAISESAFEDKMFDLQDQFNSLGETAKETADTTSQFWLEAANRMENAMSDQFFNIMQGNFDNMAQQFKTTIDRMVADLLAAQFFDLVKTSFGAGGGLASFAGLFGRAGGGPVAANQPYVVGEQGPELFVPKQSGSIVPNHRMGSGAVTVVQNVMTPDINSFRHSGRQLAQDQARLLGSARAMS